MSKERNRQGEEGRGAEGQGFRRSCSISAHTKELIHSARESAQYWRKHGREVHTILVKAWSLEADKLERGESTDYDEAALLLAYDEVEQRIAQDGPAVSLPNPMQVAESAQVLEYGPDGHSCEDCGRH